MGNHNPGIANKLLIKSDLVLAWMFFASASSWKGS